MLLGLFMFVVSFVISVGWILALVGLERITGKLVVYELSVFIPFFSILSLLIVSIFLTANLFAVIGNRLNPRKITESLYSPLLPERLAYALELIFSVLLLLSWYFADLFDAAFAIIFLVGMWGFRLSIKKSKEVSGWRLLFFSAAFALTMNMDKVIDANADEEYWRHLAFVFVWMLVQLYIAHFLFRTSVRWSALAALLILYLPLVEVPSELARQLYGNDLLALRENNYPPANELYVIRVRPGRFSVYYSKFDVVYHFELRGSNYVRSGKSDMHNRLGGTIQPIFVRTPSTIMKLKKYAF